MNILRIYEVWISFKVIQASDPESGQSWGWARWLDEGSGVVAGGNPGR